MVFLRGAEWVEKSRLTGNDTLPLIADITINAGLLRGSADAGGPLLTAVAGRGSYIADFGVIDLPTVGEVRARAGLRYSSLFPRGALELGVRKELRRQQNYELSVGAQTAGDDRRLDFVGDFAVVKFFKGAKAFYRFLFGFGWPFDGNSGPSWDEMGSALGVTQQNLPPYGRGALTIGWRTGLFSSGLETVAHPNLIRERSSNKGVSSGILRKRSPVDLLDSTPYAAYGVDVPLGALVGAGGGVHVSCTVLPEHGVLEHEVQLKIDDAQGATSLSLVLEQSMQDPRRARLRFGASYARG